MKQITATVVSNKEILPGGPHRTGRSLGGYLIQLNCPKIKKPEPGQFVMVRCGDECVLSRPFSIHWADGERIALFYAVREGGRGTAWLSEVKAGDFVTVFGPLGNGFVLPPTARKLLLVAGGTGIAPLYFLAQHALEQRHKVTLLYGTVDKNRYPVSPEIDTIAVTDDGSVGEKGFVTDLLSRFAESSDTVFACGPMPMLRNMFIRRRELKIEGKSVQVSLEVRMGCGVGVCYGCTIKTTSGLTQVCREGPIFQLNDILWDELNLSQGV